MPNLFRKLSSQNLGRPIRSLLFFILFYLYLWLKVDLRLIYHSGETITTFPVFYRTWAFFRELAPYPGGLVEYLSAIVPQSFYIGWAGALVVTLQAWLICVCTDHFLKAINTSSFRWLRFVPPILLLITYTQYTYHFVTTMALLVALLFVSLYLRVAPKGRLPRLMVFLVLSIILYAIAGGAYLLFAVLCVIYELFFRRCWQIGLLYSLSAAVISYVEGVLIFDVSIVEAFSELLPFSGKILIYETRRKMIEITYILYLLLPSAALLLGLCRIPAKKKVKKKPRHKSTKPGAKILSWYFRSSKIRWVTESCLLLGIAGSIVFHFHNNKLKTMLEADYYAYHKMWPQVLQAFHRHPNSFFIVHAVNRALYHTGRLGSDMFAYPQHPDTLFLTSKKRFAAFWKKFDVYIDLGVMNLAESALTESLIRLGERPIILKRLAMINMVKADSGAARVYLGALSKTLFHADWANNYLARLQSDPNLSMDDQIQHLRDMMMETDYGFTNYVPERILLALLQKNRYNRMAFEYLMAWYLLTGQLDKLVQNLDRLDDFNYEGIPIHYEEAILIYEVLTGTKVDLKGRQISQRTHQRSRGFSSISNRFRSSNEMAAMLATAPYFGDTYFFYYNFGHLTIAR